MATPAQILANRLNSQKSTGPRSVEGKAASSMNALKHGARAQSLIIPGEDPEALAELTAAYRDEYQPQGPEEELLLDAIVHADWTQRRMARLEAEVFQALLSASESPETTLGSVFVTDAAGANALQKIYRRQQAASREWYRARLELRRLKEERALRTARRQITERTQSVTALGASPETPAPVKAASESASPSNSEAPAPGPHPWPPFRGPRPLPRGFTGAEPPAWRL